MVSGAIDWNICPLASCNRTFCHSQDLRANIPVYCTHNHWITEYYHPIKSNLFLPWYSLKKTWRSGTQQISLSSDQTCSCHDIVLKNIEVWNSADIIIIQSKVTCSHHDIVLKKHGGLVLSRYHYHPIKSNLFSLWYSLK